jgi:mRNA-degrading endonuclease RelE of RelBE toxin-antitoxin system
MTVEQAVLEKLRELPPERQQEVLDFMESLRQKSAPPRPHRSLMGIGADLGVKITREDIDEARREMWGNFPREDNL